MNKEEKEQFLNWLKADDSNKILLQKYNDTWKELNDSSPEFLFNTEELWEKFEKKNLNSFQTGSFYKYMVAAIIFLVFYGTYYFLYQDEPKYSTGSEIAILDLYDKSSIELNHHSSLNVLTTKDDNERVVELDGEAFFRITKNKTKPFIVKTEKLSIQVLGTSFNVLSREDSVTVYVVEGAVRVQNLENKKTVVLEKKQYYQYNKDDIVVNEPGELLKWRKSSFNFYRAKVQDICRELEEFYEIKINLAPNLADRYITAKLNKDKSPAQTLTLISSILDAKVEKVSEDYFNITNK